MQHAPASDEPQHTTQEGSPPPQPQKLGLLHTPECYTIAQTRHPWILWQYFTVGIILGLLQSRSTQQPIYHWSTEAKLYLWEQLQGNALRVIAGLPLTNSNYNHLVTLLKERYAEPTQISRCPHASLDRATLTK